MKNRYLFIPAGVVILTLLIVGSVCDLSIAQALFHEGNGFSRFMAGFTAVPIGIALGFILGTLFKMVILKEYKKKWQNIILCVISFGVAIAGFYFVGEHFTSYHSYNLNKWLSLLFGALSIIPGYLLGYFFYEKMDHTNLIKRYLLIVITIVFLIATIEVFKILFPRLRYTSVIKIIDSGGDNLYRPWYLTDFSLNKQWVIEKGLVDNEEIKSFPSGHSNMGLAAAFIGLFIPKFFPKFKNKEVYFFYGGFLFFLLVAFSRILIGAHYLSDTMFAATLALLVYFISNEIYLRKIN